MRVVTIQDMSTSGALLVAGKPLVSEDQHILLTMRLDVADSVEDITLLARVRNIRPARGERVGERHYLHGVEFRLTCMVLSSVSPIANSPSWYTLSSTSVSPADSPELMNSPELVNSLETVNRAEPASAYFSRLSR